jgi:type IV pilus assembly protein PilA
MLWILYKEEINKMNNKKCRLCIVKGFTLIEVIIAVSIVVILASLTVPKITGYIDKAKTAKVLNAGKQIYTAAMWSYSDQGNTINVDNIKNAIEDTTSLGTVPTVTKNDVEKSVTIAFTTDSVACSIVIVPDNNSYIIKKNGTNIFNSNGLAISQ